MIVNLSSIKHLTITLSFELEGRFVCPILSQMQGYSKDLESQNGAIVHAINDYVQKGRQHGFLTEYQVKYPSTLPRPKNCPPMSTNTMYIYWLDIESAEERVKETFYTCLRSLPTSKSVQARFVVIQKNNRS
jgi:hypothetical protein